MRSSGNARKLAKQLVSYFLVAFRKRPLSLIALWQTRPSMMVFVIFTVYMEGENIERSWLFDIVPRTINKTQ